MGYQPRIPVRVEKLDGSASITLGIAEFDYSDDQPLYAPEVPLPGTDYMYDQLGTRPAPKQSGHVPIRFLVHETSPAAVDAAVTALKRDLVAWGLVKLVWVDYLGAEYFQYARVTARPGVRWQAGQIFQTGVTIDFRTQSDLIGLSPTPIVDVIEPITESPHEYSIDNPGGSPILNAKIYLRNVWKGMAIAPWKFENLTNSYQFEYYPDEGVGGDDIVLFDCGANRAYRSTNGGGSYSPIDSKLYRGPAQIQIMIFQPGTNSIRITDADGGAVNATVEITFNPGV